MLKKFTALRNLFEINAARQAELDTLFHSMRNFPSNSELALLRNIADHSIPEAQALLKEIDGVMASSDRLPRGLLSKMLMQQAQLPGQIVDDQKMKIYLEREYAFLSGPHRI